MQPKIFYGNLTPEDLAQALIAEFNRGAWKAQQIGRGEQIVVQIATREYRQTGGQTALSVTMRKAPDGMVVQVGKQAWLGVAASLGKTAFMALRNPFYLIGRLDDLAQDIENLQLSERVWEVIERTARTAGVTQALPERLQRVICPYCRTANDAGEPHCIACGAPLGDFQPRTCLNCGFVVGPEEQICPNCGTRFA
ncbi:MAG: hypothetical protein Fur0018_11950 [Anaerolineales bacterium]